MNLGSSILAQFIDSDDSEDPDSSDSENSEDDIDNKEKINVKVQKLDQKDKNSI